MNDLIVIQVSQVRNYLRLPDSSHWRDTQGLSEYVLANVPDATARGVVIGHDHRHNSERWAKLTAAAFISKKFRVYFHTSFVHTPMCVHGQQLGFLVLIVQVHAGFHLGW
jgi:hypothetical protein